jgi:hypothetical protein
VAIISEVVSELYSLKGMSFEECNIFFSVFPVLEDKVYNLRNLYDKNNIVFVSVSESF